MNVFAEVSEDVVYVGFHKLESRIHKTYQILVRPDVSEDSLLTLTQQILITYSGAVSKHLPATSIDEAPNRSSPSPTNAVGSRNDNQQTKDTSKVGQEKVLSPYLESINTNTAGISLPWQVIRVYLGVNMDLQRCLVLYIQPTAAAAGVNPPTNAAATSSQGNINNSVFGSIAPNSYSYSRSSDPSQANLTANPAITAPASAPYLSPARKSYLEFCETLALELNTAMREESLTIDYMSSVPASLTGPMQGFAFMGGDSGGTSRRSLDSLIDLNFIRDLHCATAQLMVSVQVC